MCKVEGSSPLNHSILILLLHLSDFPISHVMQLLEDIAAFLEESASTRNLPVSVERFLFCSREGHLVKHHTVGRAGILMLGTVQDPAVQQLSFL